MKPESIDGDPDHPILDAPYSWEVLEFVYRCAPQSWRESHIDMTFERDGVVRRLRFYAPRGLEMRGPPTTSGMCILDVSGRGMEGLGVRVANFEDGHGSPEFWAECVVDLDHLD